MDCLLRCDVLQTCRRLLTFQRNTSPLYSGYKRVMMGFETLPFPAYFSCPSSFSLLPMAAHCLRPFSCYLHFHWPPWWWMQQAPPKRRYQTNGATSPKTVIFTLAAVRTWKSQHVCSRLCVVYSKGYQVRISARRLDLLIEVLEYSQFVRL
jgi:hypothetical protein